MLISLLVWNARTQNQSQRPKELLVYCAVSVQPALREIAANYQRETGTSVIMQTGPSGALDTQARISRKGDLYIPAAQTPFLDRMEQDGTVRKVLPLASCRLVLAFHPEVEATDVTLGDIIDGKYQYAFANKEAAAGLATREALEPLGVWPQIERGAKAVLPTVTAVAQAVKQGVAVECGFVWDVTARQFRLTIIDLPELATARAAVAVGVLSHSQEPAAAEKFAEYLAAPDKGQAAFRKLGYTTSIAPGDNTE